MGLLNRPAAHDASAASHANALAGRVVQRLGAHLGLHPLAEDVDLQSRAGSKAR